MRVPLLGLVVVVLLAGCGDSDSDDDDSPRASSFVRRVDALCQSTNPRLADIQTALRRARDAARSGRASLPRTFETFEALLRRASATTERLRSRLQAIEAPSGEAAFQRALMDSLDEGLLNLRRQVNAAKAGSATRLRELSVEGSVLNARAKGLFAGRGGFRFCGRR